MQGIDAIEITQEGPNLHIKIPSTLDTYRFTRNGGMLDGTLREEVSEVFEELTGYEGFDHEQLVIEFTSPELAEKAIPQVRERLPRLPW